MLAEERAIEDILTILAGTMRIIPILMVAAQLDHEDARAEVCRLVRALAQRPDLAAKMVRSMHRPPPPPPGQQARAAATTVANRAAATATAAPKGAAAADAH